MAYVAAAVEKHGHTVDVIDGVGEWIDQHQRIRVGQMECWIQGGAFQQIVKRISPMANVIGVTCMFMHHWPIVRELVGEIKKWNSAVRVVLGGEHVSGAADLCLRESEADIAVIGEGEDTIVALLEAFDNDFDIDHVPGIAYSIAGEVRTTQRRARKKDLDDISYPAWHLIPIDRYMSRKMFHGPSLGRSMPIMATRGCPYSCTFCTAPGMWTNLWRARNPVDVVDEMAEYRRTYGATDFQFVDLTAIVNRAWTLQFCQEIVRRGWDDVNWQLPSGTRSEAIDETVAYWLKKAGCPTLVLAPDSGSKTVVQRINKKVDLDGILGAVRRLRKQGVRVESYLMIGFPDESVIEIFETYLYIIRLAISGVYSVAYSGFRPVPGTVLSQRLLSEGTLQYDDSVYFSVMKSTSIFQAKSWNKKISDRQLAVMRLFGLALFYGVSFLLRPWRIFRISANVIRGRQTTKLERVFIELGRRVVRVRSNRPLDTAKGLTPFSRKRSLQ